MFFSKNMADEAFIHPSSFHPSATSLAWNIHIWMHMTTQAEKLRVLHSKAWETFSFGWCWRPDSKTQLTPNRAGMTLPESYNQSHWFTHYLLHRRSFCWESQDITLLLSFLLQKRSWSQQTLQRSTSLKVVQLSWRDHLCFTTWHVEIPNASINIVQYGNYH